MLEESLPEVSLKILLLGDSSVGKTSLVSKYTDNVFIENHIATVGVEYKSKDIKKDDVIAKLRIWDTAGQERFRSITKSFFRNTHGILFVFDVTKRSTFENVRNWIKDSEEYADNFKKILIANKADLEKERTINNDDIKSFADKKNMIFFETSAKTGLNVNECFEKLVDIILTDMPKSKFTEGNKNKNRNTVVIENKNIEKQNNKKKCC